MHELLNRVLENGNGEVFMGGKEKYLKMENCVATAFFVSCSKAFLQKGGKIVDLIPLQAFYEIFCEMKCFVALLGGKEKSVKSCFEFFMKFYGKWLF